MICIITVVLIIIFLVLRQGGFMTWPSAANGSVAKTDFNNLVSGLKESNIFDNLLINGGFEIWQRGNSFTGTSNMFTADMWKFGGSSAGYTLTRESSELHSGEYSLKIVITSTSKTLKQKIENYKEVKGKPISFSAWVKSSVASKVRLRIQDNEGQTYSSYNSGTGWEKLTVTRTPTSAITELYVYFEFDGTSGLTAYTDDAMMVLGSEPIGFTPRSPGLEQALCERWYEEESNVYENANTINHYLYLVVRFRNKKSATPGTITFTPTITFSDGTDDTSNWSVLSSGSNENGFSKIYQRTGNQDGAYLINGSFSAEVDF